MKKTIVLTMILMLSTISLGGLLLITSGCAYGYDDDYGYGRGYYPYYRQHYNPVVRRDYHSREQYAPDGTRHQEDVVEDKQSSYYSPGRNHAITRPRTKVESWSEEPGQQTTREKTKWIGADGRPHSTTVTRDTTVDAYGDTHTNTHVELRKAKP